MKIELAGWRSEGLRCPDVDIDLRSQSGGVSPISLIQASTGTGKTTTTKLLKACLHGRASSWSADEVREFRRHNDPRPSGVFAAKLVIDGRPLTIEIELDYDDGSVRYRTTSPDTGGMIMHWGPPMEVRRFLDKRFLDLFIFDGELAKGLLDPEQAQAEFAIDALCQLYLLDEIEQVAAAAWDRETKTATVTTGSGLKKYTDLQKAISNRKDVLEKNRAKAVSELETVQADIAKNEQRIRDRISDDTTTRDLHTEAYNDKVQAEADVEKFSSMLAQALRNPNALHPIVGKSLNYLKENLDRLRLPENTSAQFFEEILQEKECICGRQMDEESIAQIRLRSKQFLGEKQIGVINEIKSDIERYISNSSDIDPYEAQKGISQDLEQSRIRLKKASQQIASLENQLIKAGDDKLEEWKKQLANAKQRESEFIGLIALNDKDPEDDRLSSRKDDNEVLKSLSIPLLTRKLKEVEQRISEITETVDLKDRTNLLQQILRSANDKAQMNIKSELLDVCNQRLKDVLVNDVLQIESIDSSLTLANQKRASEGQTLSVGYVFLMSILNRGNHDFPLVVDSPAGKLSTEPRAKIGRLIPSLCAQFVAFTLDTERPGFVTALEEAGKQIKYLTLFRKTEGTSALLKNLPGEGVVQTDNSVVVSGQKYFHDFNYEGE
jgi:DNA sulfur modification protein DndD